MSIWSDQDWLKTHPDQFGFTAGRQCGQHLVAADQMLHEDYSTAAFLDLHGAYDSVDHALLIECLVKAGCPPSTINSLYFLMMHNASSQLVVNGILDQRAVKRERGIFQGDVFSPKLFAIFIDSLAHKLGSMDSWCPVRTLLFADDVAIFTKKNYDMVKALRICTTWADSNFMRWNARKCGVMVKYKNEVPDTFQLQGQFLPIVDEYKYLGVVFKITGADWASFITAIETKSWRLLTFYKAVGFKWTPYMRLVVFKAYIDSLFQYAMPYLVASLVAYSDKATLRAFIKTYTDLQNKCLKWVFFTGADNRVATMRFLAGVEDVAKRIARQMINAGKALSLLPQECTLIALNADVQPIAASEPRLPLKRLDPLRDLDLGYSSPFEYLRDFSLVYTSPRVTPAPKAKLEIYSSTGSRSPSGMDRMLKARVPLEQMLIMVRWRLGLFYNSKTKKKCNAHPTESVSSRSHLKVCLPGFLPREVVSGTLATSLSLTQAHPLSMDLKYCFIDHLLNDCTSQNLRLLRDALHYYGFF